MCNKTNHKCKQRQSTVNGNQILTGLKPVDYSVDHDFSIQSGSILPAKASPEPVPQSVPQSNGNCGIKDLLFF